LTAAAAAGSKKITEYFGAPVDVVESDSDGADTDDDRDEPQLMCSKEADETLSKLETERDRACLLGDMKGHTMISALMAHVGLMSAGLSKFKNSRQVVSLFFVLKGAHRQKRNQKKSGHSAATRSRQYRRGAERIRGALSTFISTGTLPKSRKGRAAGLSLINDEDVRALCREVIGEHDGKRFSSKMFQSAISEKLRERGLISEKMIGGATACNWLRSLGMEIVNDKKGLYKDGHERSDVVEFREKYVGMGQEVYNGMVQEWSGDEMGDVIEPPGGATHVRVYHDETIVAQNEGKTSYWGKKDEQDRCFAKGKGKSLMVSGFICPCHGKFEMLSTPWREALDPQGRTYYWNVDTKATQWKAPAEGKLCTSKRIKFTPIKSASKLPLP
jgi:hypothetical protein